MHHSPVLADWLAQHETARVVDAVAKLDANELASDRCIQGLVEACSVAHIELGERYVDEKPWRRRMQVGDQDTSSFRSGLRPGDSYTVEYTVYRLGLVTGSDLVVRGANGGAMIDPMFVIVEGDEIIVRAVDAAHRNRLIKEIVTHVDRANQVVDRWNIVDLPQVVRRQVSRRRSEELLRQRRVDDAAAAGFQPTSERRARASTGAAVPQEAPLDAASHLGPTPEASFLRPLARVVPGDRRRKSTTALVSWSHADPGFTNEQRGARESNVARLVNALRRNGIDADIDLFHEHESTDWTRWGPGRMNEVDVVLVVCSTGWRLAWEGSAEAGRGATAEVNVLRSWFQDQPDRFQQRVRLVVLPGEEQVIPTGLHVLVHHRLTSFDEVGMESLLRALTEQPRFTPEPLGDTPVLPAAEPRADASLDPVTTNHLSQHGELTLRSSVPGDLPSYIESALDDFVASEQRQFEENEGAAAQLSDAPSPVINLSFIDMTCQLDDRLVSIVAECSYLAPGAAVSYQKTIGLTYRRSDGFRLNLADVFVGEVAELHSLGESFSRHARIQVSEAVDVSAVPPGATLAVNAVALGICTSRYDIGPGYLGAAVIWIPHDEIARLYQPSFARLLPG